jgi:hypothetical protein
LAHKVVDNLWRYTMISNTDALEVEFEGDGRKFTKRFPMLDNTEEFLQQKLNDLEILSNTFATLQGLRGIQETVCNGWYVVYEYVAMPADWIEVFVTIISPTQKFTKMYSTVGGKTLEYIAGYIQGEKTLVAEWVANADVEALTNYFGQEVTL